MAAIIQMFAFFRSIFWPLWFYDSKWNWVPRKWVHGNLKVSSVHFEFSYLLIQAIELISITINFLPQLHRHGSLLYNCSLCNRIWHSSVPVTVHTQKEFHISIFIFDSPDNTIKVNMNEFVTHKNTKKCLANWNRIHNTSFLCITYRIRFDWISDFVLTVFHRSCFHFAESVKFV